MCIWIITVEKLEKRTNYESDTILHRVRYILYNLAILTTISKCHMRFEHLKN